MAFDIESLGGGAGTGIIGAILVAFGFGRRVSKLEDGKQDKSSCIPIHKNIDEKFEIVIKGQEKLFDKIDSINEYLRNGK